MQRYDLVVIGAGPAGMTAAIYGVRANLKVLLLDKLAPGGQIINTNEIENYPGAGKVNGAELAFKMFEHTQELGVDFDYRTVTKIVNMEDVKHIYTEEDDTVIEALTVIVATGTRPRTLNIPGEEEYKGSAISWCAICDGGKYRDKDVVIIGGGNSAVDEGTYLATITKSLSIITDFDLTADPISSDYLRSLPNVTVYPYKRVVEFIGEGGQLVGVKIVDKESGENEQVVKCDGVFEYIGAIPSVTTMFIYSMLALLFLPLVGNMFGFSDQLYGILSGVAVNDTASAIATAFSWSDEAGSIATVVKLVRTLFIVPVSIGLICYKYDKQRKNSLNNHAEKVAINWSEITRIIPKFVIYFILAVIFASVVQLPVAIASLISKFSKIFMTMALFTIGLGVHMKQIKKAGMKPIILGGASWFAVLTVSVILIMFLYI
jgi:thioredoxin reductase (NADPH)